MVGSPSVPPNPGANTPEPLPPLARCQCTAPHACIVPTSHRYDIGILRTDLMTADTTNNTPSGCDLPTDGHGNTIKALKAIRDLQFLPDWDVVERVLGLRRLDVLLARLLRGSWEDAVRECREIEQEHQQPKALREGFRAPRPVSEDLQDFMAIALGFSDNASAIVAQPNNPFFNPSLSQPWPSAPTAPTEHLQADAEAPAPTCSPLAPEHNNCPSGGCPFVPTPAPDDNL
jgi:hypothetical protein